MLPDLANLFLKTPVLSTKIDLTKDTLKEIAFKIGRQLGEKDNLIYDAFQKGLQVKTLAEEKSKEAYQNKIGSAKKKVVLIGHPYNLYDNYVNMDVKDKLEKLGIEAIFIDEVPILKEDEGSKIKFHWESGKEMLSRAQKIAKEDIAGAIEISAFQCGCDAVIKEFIEREFRQRKIPFLYLLIDEQTAEAGLQTRLEAFADTLNR